MKKKNFVRLRKLGDNIFCLYPYKMFKNQERTGSEGFYNRLDFIKEHTYKSRSEAILWATVKGFTVINLK